MTEIVDDELYTMAEVAAICRISIKTLTHHRDNGDITVTILGRRTYRFYGAAIRAFLQEKSGKACPSGRKRARRSTTTTSRSEVSDFLAARERRIQARRNGTKTA
jgi:SpoVK/Ycf46/Vps4 family AAA+-type ATPase